MCMTPLRVHVPHPKKKTPEVTDYPEEPPTFHARAAKVSIVACRRRDPNRFSPTQTRSTPMVGNHLCGREG